MRPWEVALPDLPDRPAPLQPLHQRARTWLQWVGPGRVAATSIAVLAVLAAAYWLVRPPAATTESTLPYTTGAGSSAPDSSTVSSSDEVAPSAPPSTALTELVVHVAGAVAHPGVYRVAPASRVIDAVDRAGGLAGDAQPDALNLAAPLIDGERVYVPRVGESVPVATPAVGEVSDAPAGPVNLNRAEADELDQLPGVGPATAAAIIAHREQHGPFASVDDLADVRGIGPAKLEALRGLVTV
ncbi:MAG: helix-hairpin-helix domain-containing protein [Actinobacteria bacterium]|nr:helix-hairpin-helix domain-containing protein [Actinomycetota bacterium]